MTAELINFLRERFDEDELVARGARPSPWQRDYHSAFMHGIKSADGMSLFDGLMESPNVQHVIRQQPSRALIEAEAKRRILALHSDATGHSCSITDETGYELNYANVAGGEACTTLRLLALPYVSHPDYRQEWRP